MSDTFDQEAAFQPSDDGPIGVPTVIERLEHEELHCFEADEAWDMLTMNEAECHAHVVKLTEAFAASNFECLQDLFDATPPYRYEPIFTDDAPIAEGDMSTCVLATYVSPSPLHRGDLLKAAIMALVAELRSGHDTMLELVLVELNSRIVRVVNLRGWTSDERADFVDWLRAEASK
jgi:hypothetical protein